MAAAIDNLRAAAVEASRDARRFWRVNWRLVLAVAVNNALWAGIIAAVLHVVGSAG